MYFADEMAGYGNHSWPDGRNIKGFWFKDKEHGIAEFTDAEGLTEYRVYENGAVLQTLTEKEVKSINEGTKKIPQM